MDFALDLFKSNVSLLPIRHLKGFHEVEDNLHLPVVLLDVVWSRIEIVSHFVQHIRPDVVELHRLVDDVTDIGQFLNPFLTTQPDLRRYSVHSLDNFNHIFQSGLNGFLEFLLIGVESHVFLLDSNIEQTHFPGTIPHLIKQNIHGSVRNADKGLNHNIVNKFDKIG